MIYELRLMMTSYVEKVTALYLLYFGTQLKINNNGESK